MNESPLKSYRKNSEAIIAAGVAIVICLFAHLGAIGLVGPDEPRYAWIARAMATSGDWVTPRLYGQPWFEKPALYYWAAAIGFLLHLPAEYATRLPSAVAALAAAVALWWIAREHHDQGSELQENPALLAPLFFASSVAGIGFSRAATPDMLFSACITLAMASAAAVLHSAGALPKESAPASNPRGDFAALLSFGVFLGLGVLAKGPAAVLLAGGAIFLWAIATKQWRPVLRFLHPIALISFCVVALPWYVLCALRNPDFLHVFIFQHNFERYLTPLFQHRQPFWFFAPVTLLALVPWTALLCPATHQGLRAWRSRRLAASPGFFFACWAIFPILFFSLSQSKLPSYILPSMPPLCLLLAVAFSGVAKDTSPASEKSLRTIGLTLGITWMVLGIVALVWRSRLAPAMREDAGRTILILALIAVAGGIGIAALSAARGRKCVVLSIALVVLMLEAASVFALPSIDPFISARWHGQFLRNDAYPDRIFTYQLQRSWNYGLAFYLGRELPEWSPHHREPALVLTTPAGLREMQKLGRVSGTLDETYKGILYVPAYPAPF